MPTDKQRIVRALEVLESTGRSLARWQREPGTPVLTGAETIRLLVLPDRQKQGELIDARFDAMVAAGALEEVQALLGRGFSSELPIMRALGVAPLAAHISGTLGLAEAVAAAKTDTRKYAKRQLTWLRRNMIAWTTIKTQDPQRFAANDLSFIDC
jgi:tRNA dimethylallyltransferase